MAKNRLLIYGATGYMGRLLAESAFERKLPVVLAARHRERLAEVAERFEFPYRTLKLESPLERDQRLRRESTSSAEETQPESPNAALYRALDDVRVVLNAAGPFSETAMTLARACVKTRTHYVDIGGEYNVFEELNDLHLKARDAGVVIVPGVGLTVFGSDILARIALVRMRGRMGEPHFVRVALSRVPFVSRGSAKTMLDGARDGVRVVRNGHFEVAAVGTLVRSFTFGTESDFERSESRVCTALTLADTLTVGVTVRRTWDPTASALGPGVPNVEAYVEASAMERMTYELGGEFALALRTQPLKALFDQALRMWPEGPDASERDESRQQVALEIEDRYRRGVHARLSTPNSYDFTVCAALAVAERIRKEGCPAAGFLSPAWAFADPDELAGLLANCSLGIVYRGFPELRPDFRAGAP